MKTVQTKKDLTLTGTVSSRKCPACGHHEIGITTKEGVFYPLRTGTLVQVLNSHPEKAPTSKEASSTRLDVKQKEEDQTEKRAWAPEPVKCQKSLRLKYGVMIGADIDSERMSSSVFQTAYLEKLRNLIEKEVHTPIPVILDQFFTSPHLASGDAGEIALAMWDDLEEIRQPVMLVKAWMEEPEEENLRELLRPTSEEKLSGMSVSDRELKKELEHLSLREFLNLL